MNGHISIAIDGPSGAGKSTLARRTAERFGFAYLDTGAIYRSVALFMLRRGLSLRDGEAVLQALPALRLTVTHDGQGAQHMLLDGEDVSEDIRRPEVSVGASDVSALAGVRDFLMDTQRDFAREHDVVMDGRDIGTVVLPRAGLKIFLTASPEMRARRRLKELLEKGRDACFEEVLRDIEYRDENDSRRAVAPLRPAEDAVLLDTTELDLEQSLQAICALVEERFGL